MYLRFINTLPKAWQRLKGDSCTQSFFEGTNGSLLYLKASSRALALAQRELLSDACRSISSLLLSTPSNLFCDARIVSICACLCVSIILRSVGERYFSMPTCSYKSSWARFSSLILANILRSRRASLRDARRNCDLSFIEYQFRLDV